MDDERRARLEQPAHFAEQLLRSLDECKDPSRPRTIGRDTRKMVVVEILDLAGIVGRCTASGLKPAVG